VELVQDQVVEPDALPAVVGPVEDPGVDDGRRAGDAIGLMTRRRVRQRVATAEAYSVPITVTDTVDPTDPRAPVRVGMQRGRTAVAEDDLDALGSGRPDLEAGATVDRPRAEWEARSSRSTARAA
jgi:hypothetical protein